MFKRCPAVLLAVIGVGGLAPARMRMVRTFALTTNFRARAWRDGKGWGRRVESGSGTVTGTPTNASGGWLMLDKSLADLRFTRTSIAAPDAKQDSSCARRRRLRDGVDSMYR